MAPTLEVPPLNEQVQQLQGQVRRLRKLTLALTALGSGAVLMAAASPPREKVVARAFVLVDEYGQEVGSLAADADGPRLIILHPDTGEVAIRLGVKGSTAEPPPGRLAPVLPEVAETPMDARLRRALEEQRQRLLERFEGLSGSELAAAWSALPAGQRSLLAGTTLAAVAEGRESAVAVPAVAVPGVRAGGAFLELFDPEGALVFYRSAAREKAGIGRR